MTMSCKSLTKSLNISLQLQLVITYKVSNSHEPDKALTEYRPDLGPNCLQRVSGSKLFAKGYQQMTMSCKCLTKSLNISVQLQLVITYNVSNSLDPDKALTEYRPDLGPNCLQRVISR